MPRGDGDAQRTMSNVASELPYDIVYASSTDYAPIFPSAVELMLMQAAPGALPVRWMSSKSCSYPQEIGLILSTRAYVKSIRIVTHLLFAPSKVEVCASDDARVQRYMDHNTSTGDLQLAMQVYCSTDCPSLCSMDWPCAGTNARPTDIRMDIHEPLNVLKFMLHAPRVVGSNLYHQVAIFQIQVLGVPLPQPLHISSIPLVGTEDASSPSTNEEVYQALLDSAVPMDLIAQVLDVATDVDAYTAKAVQHATMVKASCIQQDDYDRAKDLATRIASLIDLGKQIHAIATLKTHAVAMEAFDQAQMYHMQLEALAVTREKRIADTFAVCHASQTSKTTDTSVLDVPVAPPDPYIATIHDVAIRRWLVDEKKMTGCPASGNSRRRSPADAFLATMWGRDFMACTGSPVWNIRRACVEIAEQHVAILVHVFDVETLYEMYIELVRTTFLVDPTIPVLIATLHLVRTMYERPCMLPPTTTPVGRTSKGLGFGTWGLRRGVLRPGIERIIDAIFQCSAYFNTLLREDCIRTVRFLAQQPHVAGLALECTWQRTVQVSPGFERVLGLTFLQDQLQTILCLAMESSLSFNEPSKAMGQLYEDMSAFLTSTVITTDDTVRGAALECLSLVHACQQRDFRGVVAISREVHVPLFRTFPFSDSEADRLVDQAQVFANSHQLPVQLATYELDAPGLDGFHEFHQLKKGTVAFAGQVSPRYLESTTRVQLIPTAALASDLTLSNTISSSLQQTPTTTTTTRPQQQTINCSTPHSITPSQPPLTTVEATPNRPVDLSIPSQPKELHPRASPSPFPPTTVSPLHPSQSMTSFLPGTTAEPFPSPSVIPSLTSNDPLRLAFELEPSSPMPAAAPVTLVSAQSPHSSQDTSLIVEKAVSSPVKPLAGRKNQVAPATTLEIPPSSVSVNGTPRTARERIETLQVVAEVAKKVTHADDKKAGCSIS
ncbi:hypothetical protein, variant 1 [Aphanomyces astaci]|uniref:Centrosomal protein CEP104 N-terminal domain-containing protein n=2 Tax=Aphanomyces astaci TaxID=112090 RepID=W4GW12_APHAT|nr:hypothetical protein, variant 1 [Aphanomyces astaci]ETV83083.1 hypothetical protein, variant 1 [Aphanomyces astaci]|eukprot:XP_009827755.1 hypothetical protein, variant 1 [Aphanomyces astaci]